MLREIYIYIHILYMYVSFALVNESYMSLALSLYIYLSLSSSLYQSLFLSLSIFLYLHKQNGHPWHSLAIWDSCLREGSSSVICGLRKTIPWGAVNAQYDRQWIHNIQDVMNNIGDVHTSIYIYTHIKYIYILPISYTAVSYCQLPEPP